MKVEAVSPEEAVQLAWSVPLSPDKEALQTDSRPGKAGVPLGPEALPQMTGMESAASQAEQPQGAATCS